MVEIGIFCKYNKYLPDFKLTPKLFITYWKMLVQVYQISLFSLFSHNDAYDIPEELKLCSEAAERFDFNFLFVELNLLQFQ